MPVYGVTPITVPGVPAAWAALSEKFGKLPLKEVLIPAIRYAEEGYPLTPILGKYWKAAYKKFKNTFTSEEFVSWFETFAPNGKAPEIGRIGHHQIMLKHYVRLVKRMLVISMKAKLQLKLIPS